MVDISHMVVSMIYPLLLWNTFCSKFMLCDYQLVKDLETMNQ
jgi:hypothetical protein